MFTLPPKDSCPPNEGPDEESKRQENAKKAKETADLLFPGEKWIPYEDGIFLSLHRAIGKKSNFEDELRDARILRDLGSTVYLVPEIRTVPVKKYDAIVDGIKMEFKNMSGKNSDTLIDHFYNSRKQAPNVFINLGKSPLSKEKILRILYGARNSPKYDEKNKFPEGGLIILKIKGYNNLVYLDVNDLKTKEKNTGAN